MLLENFIISNVDGTMLSVGQSSSSRAHFIDITNFTCILILYGLSRTNLLEYFLNVSWIFRGYWLGWICRHLEMGRASKCFLQ